LIYSRALIQNHAAIHGVISVKKESVYPLLWVRSGRRC